MQEFSEMLQDACNNKNVAVDGRISSWYCKILSSIFCYALDQAYDNNLDYLIKSYLINDENIISVNC